MARLERLPRSEQKSLPAMSCPSFDTEPWVVPRPAAERRVSIVNTAGLMLAGERPVAPRAPGYRTIPDAAPDAEVLMSHVSVNFDRSGFFQDVNCALPRERLRELAEQGVIGAVADSHHSFMGATEPHHMEPHARELARGLLAGGVDTALLVPV